MKTFEEEFKGIPMYNILVSLPSNKDAWFHYVQEQVKRIRKSQDSEDKKELEYAENCIKYLLHYIELGWAKHDEDEE